MRAVFAGGKFNREEGWTQPLSIISCGSYRDVEQDLITVRLNGTDDYHLLFVIRGVVESEERRITEHQCLLFFPHEKQEYQYCIGEDTLYHWVHFVGADVAEIFGDSPTRIFDYETRSSEVHTLLPMLLNAVVNKENYENGYAETLLRAILALLTSKVPIKRFGKVLNMMKNFSQNYTLADYAQAYHMSEGHFIRAFKKEMGISPMAYRLHLQIENAKQLLSKTSLKISTVAEFSGFSDAMYFSRAFKKETGLSPTQYRENLV